MKITKYIYFKFTTLGVRSLANASRARQFNPLNPPGVGWVPLPQTNMAAVVGRARSCMVGHAWSCVVVRRGARSAVRSRARSCVRGSAWSCVVVRGRSCVVVRGRACVVGHSWSCVVVRGLSCVVVHGCARSVVRFAASTAVTRTNERRKERTTYNNPPNPPVMGWVKFVLSY